MPDAATGWCFRLAVRPELVREGAEIAVPSGDARPLLEVIRAPAIVESRETAGRIRIRRIVPGRILADVELADRGVPGGWQLRRAVWFRAGSEPPYPPARPAAPASPSPPR